MINRMKLFMNFGLRGSIGSIILFVLLVNTKFTIFALFPIVIAIGMASMKYSSMLKSYEQNLFVFLEDLKDLLQGGMNIVTAMEVITEHDYGALNSSLEHITAQIKIGVPFDEALIKSFQTIKSPMFGKVAQVISESTRFGGNLVKIFSSVSNYVKTINEMNDERKSKTFSTIFSSYFMFFVFIAIILIIQIVFLPMLSSSDLAQGSGDGQSMADINFNAYFLYLLIIQASFAGPIIGKISENSAIAGVKHSIILLSTSVPIYVLVSMLFISA